MAASEDTRGDRQASFGFVIPTYGPFADPGAVRALVQAGEDLGYDDVWFGDRVTVPAYAAPFSDPRWYDALACSAIALGATRRLRIGTDVLVLPYRQPLQLARFAATADQLSTGRFILGVGIGYMEGEFAAQGLDHRDRARMTEENLEVLRLALSEDNPISYEGDFVRFEEVHTGPSPSGAGLPIWVGGNHRNAQRRAARLGDGWHPLFPTPEVYAAGRQVIEEELGGLPHDFAMSYSCPETRVVDEGAETPEAFTYDQAGEIPEDFGYAPATPRAANGRSRFMGTAEQVADDVHVYMEAGVRHFTLRFWAGAPEFGVDEFIAQARRFAEEVRPRFGPVAV